MLGKETKTDSITDNNEEKIEEKVQLDRISVFPFLKIPFYVCVCVSVVQLLKLIHLGNCYTYTAILCKYTAVFIHIHRSFYTHTPQFLCTYTAVFIHVHRIVEN
jgi:hypothetical protein